MLHGDRAVAGRSVGQVISTAKSGVVRRHGRLVSTANFAVGGLFAAPGRSYCCSAGPNEGCSAMDMIKYATICAAAVASVTACGGVVSHDAAPAGQSVVPFATSESASRCSSATPDVLKSAARSESGQPFSESVTVKKVLCSGDWAKALIAMKAPPNTNPPGVMLFHNDGGGWRTVTYGSGFDCTDEGVPPSIAAELEC